MNPVHVVCLWVVFVAEVRALSESDNTHINNNSTKDICATTSYKAKLGPPLSDATDIVRKKIVAGGSAVDNYPISIVSVVFVELWIVGKEEACDARLNLNGHWTIALNPDVSIQARDTGKNGEVGIWELARGSNDIINDDKLALATITTTVANKATALVAVYPRALGGGNMIDTIYVVEGETKEKPVPVKAVSWKAILGAGCRAFLGPKMGEVQNEAGPDHYPSNPRETEAFLVKIDTDLKYGAYCNKPKAFAAAHPTEDCSQEAVDPRVALYFDGKYAIKYDYQRNDLFSVSYDLQKKHTVIITMQDDSVRTISGPVTGCFQDRTTHPVTQLVLVEG